MTPDGRSLSEHDVGMLLRALTLAAERHAHQRRKGAIGLPYINHLIGVLVLLWEVGGVRDITTLVAAILHDVLEDTVTSPEELEGVFGPEVRSVVAEVTDDKSLPKETRKALQVAHAPTLSTRAKLIKLADKIHNVEALIDDTPLNWSQARLMAYVDWADQVVEGLRGVNIALELRYDVAAATARRRLLEEGGSQYYEEGA